MKKLSTEKQTFYNLLNLAVCKGEKAYSTENEKEAIELFLEKHKSESSKNIIPTQS